MSREVSTVDSVFESVTTRERRLEALHDHYAYELVLERVTEATCPITGLPPGELDRHRHSVASTVNRIMRPCR